MLEQCGYKIINKIDPNYATRVTSTSKTIIDHISTSLKEHQFHLAIIESAMSDHRQLYLEIKKYKPNDVLKTKYEAVNYVELYKTLNSNNSNEDYLELENRLISSINKSKFIKTKILNPPRKDWINKNIIRQINERNELWLRHKTHPNDEIMRNNFIKKRNEVHSIIQKEKSEYYYKAFEECRHKSSKMWKLINELSYNKFRETSAPSKLLTQEGRVVTEIRDICDCFNDFFSSVGSILANQIPNVHNNMTTTCTATTSEADFYTISQWSPTTSSEISKIIDSLKINTSSGLDGINTKCIRCVKDTIVDELAKCINQCLEKGVFPNSLKIAKVSPIYKSGSKLDPGNYRPISVLPVLSKVFERVLYNRLNTHLDTQHFLYEKQYGFRQKSNTLSATIDLVTKIKVGIDKKQIALGIFIDLKKAFDTVSHKLLLSKLKETGIVGSALDIFSSYLSDRRQVVKIGSDQSEPQLITFGVPQGSILGPLLFLIYINSIKNIGLKGNISLYADDTSLFYYGHSIDAIISDAQCDLNLLNLWFQSNLLTINIAKTNYIIFTAINKKISDFTPLRINNQLITKVDNEKYLGLLLDNFVTFKPHINKIKAKLVSLTGALRGIVKCLPWKVRYTIYNSLVKPQIDYLIEIWGAAAKTNLDVIQVAQNKLVKVLFNFDYRTSTAKVYKQTKIMNISQTYRYYTCVLIRKIINKQIHTEISFTKTIPITKLRPRVGKELKLRTARTKYGKKCILNEGVSIYNKLPKDIREAKSMTTFKRLLKSHLFSSGS